MENTVYKFKTTEERQARLWINSGRMHNVLYELLSGEFHRVLTKREREFKDVDDALEWVRQELHGIVMSEGIAEFMEED